MDTQANFLELIDLIKANRPEYIEESGEAFSRQDIEFAIKTHPIPEALITIYSCINSEGNYISCSSDLIPTYNLIPLHQINYDIDTFQEIRSELVDRIGEAACHELMDWRADMIPFLQDCGGSVICVRTLPNDESVWAFPKALEPHKLNTNLDRFILTAIKCYQQGAYYKEPYYEDVCMWDIDGALAQEIVKVIDPEIENYSAP
jgi:hypothetical protein